MLRYMLDTVLCVRALRDRPAGYRELFKRRADSLAVSTVTLFELLYGVERSARPDHNRAEVERLAALLEILPFDAAAASHAAAIRADLETRGESIGAYDLQIAGHARSRGLTVVTGNLREFRRVDGLLCEDWDA